jgi:hypothetical protein
MRGFTKVEVCVCLFVGVYTFQALSRTTTSPEVSAAPPDVRSLSDRKYTVSYAADCGV